VYNESVLPIGGNTLAQPSHIKQEVQHTHHRSWPSQASHSSHALQLKSNPPLRLPATWVWLRSDRLESYLQQHQRDGWERQQHQAAPTGGGSSRRGLAGGDPHSLLGLLHECRSRQRRQPAAGVLLAARTESLGRPALDPVDCLF
jgi:hypothetical protein